MSTGSGGDGGVTNLNSDSGPIPEGNKHTCMLLRPPYHQFAQRSECCLKALRQKDSRFSLVLCPPNSLKNSIVSRIKAVFCTQMNAHLSAAYLLLQQKDEGEQDGGERPLLGSIVVGLSQEKGGQLAKIVKTSAKRYHSGETVMARRGTADSVARSPLGRPSPWPQLKARAAIIGGWKEAARHSGTPLAGTKYERCLDRGLLNNSISAAAGLAAQGRLAHPRPSQRADPVSRKMQEYDQH
ncbi:hypothetical protein BKA66DRAFT_439032 [Pyrenochaeta sp. MPI-SDFR-AT-0127]|nr:hypothetical protein BKA66DRAFT_439032 [Pyrenochaeta sp. MPI-SDFR-AT-0127]